MQLEFLGLSTFIPINYISAEINPSGHPNYYINNRIYEIQGNSRKNWRINFKIETAICLRCECESNCVTDRQTDALNFLLSLKADSTHCTRELLSPHAQPLTPTLSSLNKPRASVRPSCQIVSLRHFHINQLSRRTYFQSLHLCCWNWKFGVIRNVRKMLSPFVRRFGRVARSQSWDVPVD